MISKLRYGNSVIEYNVVKSKRRKTSEVRVDVDGVEIRTPITKKDSEIQEIINEKKQWIFKKQLEFKDRKKQHSKNLYKTTLKDTYLEKRILKLSSKIGISPSKIIIKPLKNRWGSTTKEGTITLNSHLLKAPKKIIDYILIHELCHLKISGHSRKFWAFLSKFEPNYKEKIAWLDQNYDLVEELK